MISLESALAIERLDDFKSIYAAQLKVIVRQRKETVLILDCNDCRFNQFSSSSILLRNKIRLLMFSYEQFGHK